MINDLTIFSQLSIQQNFENNEIVIFMKRDLFFSLKKYIIMEFDSIGDLEF